VSQAEELRMSLPRPSQVALAGAVVGLTAGILFALADSLATAVVYARRDWEVTRLANLIPSSAGALLSYLADGLNRSIVVLLPVFLGVGLGYAFLLRAIRSLSRPVFRMVLWAQPLIGMGLLSLYAAKWDDLAGGRLSKLLGYGYGLSIIVSGGIAYLLLRWLAEAVAQGRIRKPAEVMVAVSAGLWVALTACTLAFGG
jgi:hypothetical protein